MGYIFYWWAEFLTGWLCGALAGRKCNQGVEHSLKCNGNKEVQQKVENVNGHRNVAGEFAQGVYIGAWL